MKRGILILLLVLMTVPVLAQSRKTNCFIGTGVSIPVSPDDFKNIWNTGVNLQFGANHSYSENIHFGVDFAMHKFGINGTEFLKLPENTAFYRVTGGSMYILNLMPVIKYRFSSTSIITPYIETGMGIFFSVKKNYSLITTGSRIPLTIKPENKINFGTKFGGGIEVELNDQFSIAVGLNYVIGFTDIESTQFFPVKISLKF